MTANQESQGRPVGIFDSGYGGLSIFRSIEAALPQYEYVYLGDNARAPYGSRSFEMVLRFTTEGAPADEAAARRLGEEAAEGLRQAGASGYLATA